MCSSNIIWGDFTFIFTKNCNHMNFCVVTVRVVLLAKPWRKGCCDFTTGQRWYFMLWRHVTKIQCQDDVWCQHQFFCWFKFYLVSLQGIYNKSYPYVSICFTNSAAETDRKIDLLSNPSLRSPPRLS